MLYDAGVALVLFTLFFNQLYEFVSDCDVAIGLFTHQLITFQTVDDNSQGLAYL